MTPVALIWDYDGAIGQVNSSYPYNFHEESLLREIENVESILNIGRSHDISMTFAITGFTAESGAYPYHFPEQIRSIYSHGHEVASHSWRHEWFPFLQEEQIRRSLARSKKVLEACIGVEGAVRGFVPPFSRPMSWYAKGAVSLGDRVLGPWYRGASLGTLLNYVAGAGYTWCRVAFRPLWRKVFGDRRQVKREAFQEKGLWCIPQHCTGFGERALELLESHITTRRALFIVAHPLGLTLPHDENLLKFKRFVDVLGRYRDEQRVRTVTVSQYLHGLNCERC